MKEAENVALAGLERRIGYRFNDRLLLRQALTHASALADNRSSGQSYERLEFLGDRVLGLVIAEMLLEAFPGAPEGELSPRLAELVRKETCAEVAVDLDIGAALIVGGSEQQRRALQTTNVLGDVCEAVIGAIFIDGGFDAGRRLVADNWRRRMAELVTPRRDAKSMLQEWAHRLRKSAPTYALTERRGPDHEPVFAVEVRVGEMAPGIGEGRTRRDAEQAAANAVLLREGVWKEAG